MDLNKLNNIKNDILTDRTFREEQNAILMMKVHNFICDVQRLILAFNTKIEELINNIDKIPDDTLQDAINNLVQDNFDADTYSLKFGIKIPLMAIIDGYSTYDSDDNIINYTYIYYLVQILIILFIIQII